MDALEAGENGKWGQRLLYEKQWLLKYYRMKDVLGGLRKQIFWFAGRVWAKLIRKN